MLLILRYKDNGLGREYAIQEFPSGISSAYSESTERAIEHYFRGNTYRPLGSAKLTETPEGFIQRIWGSSREILGKTTRAELEYEYPEYMI